jgi:hypothetical protein
MFVIEIPPQGEMRTKNKTKGAPDVVWRRLVTCEAQPHKALMSYWLFAPIHLTFSPLSSSLFYFVLV